MNISTSFLYLQIFLENRRAGFPRSTRYGSHGSGPKTETLQHRDQQGLERSGAAVGLLLQLHIRYIVNDGE